ncbi:hypothetical protein GGI12_003148 [Dipsacomyces acuminosporus]|nr:hypothetical protein GGI12_003148 [Dipsacomyces acuminosporus]
MQYTHNTLANAAASIRGSVKRLQPNYFLSIRLDDSLVQRQILQFHDHIRTNHSKWRRYLIKPAQMHLTLGVMHLGSDSAINGAHDLLEGSTDLVQKHLTRNPTIALKGIGTFGSNRVVYAKAKDSSGELARFVRELRLRFWSNGYAESPPKAPPYTPFFQNNEIPDGPPREITAGKVDDWAPHATLMKIRGTDFAHVKRLAKGSFQAASRKKEAVCDNAGKKQTFSNYFSIPPAAFEPFNDHEFGTFVLRRIELVSMFHPKDSSGYYQRVGGIDIRIQESWSIP